MPITCTEKVYGRTGEHKGDSPNESRVWFVTGTDDQAAAVGALITASPTTVTTADGKTLKRSGLAFEQFVDQPAAQAWEITVKYGTTDSQQSEPDEVRISFDTGGGATEHLTQAREHINTYPDDADKPDFAGAIGVTPDGVDGVDVGLREFNFTITKTFAEGDYPDPDALYRATKCYNDDVVTYTDTISGLSLTFLEGEALLQCVRASEPRGDGAIEFTYSFSASPNIDNKTIGTITGIDKKGWEYLWVYYVPKPGGTGVGRVMLQVPKFASVERCYDPADLQAGIGL
jgi:hypothetical protein